MAELEESKIDKTICPTVEELSVILNNVQCGKCGLVFRNEPRYRMHDLKVHQRKKLSKIVKENVKYHCPVQNCIYAPDSQRHFSTMKYLKQHYLKVHAEKSFPCARCNKGFSTQAAKEAHTRVCGIHFTCSCQKVFTSYEALLTHAKRSSHVVDEKYKTIFRRISPKTGKVPQINGLVTNKLNKPIAILPNDGDSGGQKCRIDAKSNGTCDAAVQTDECRKSRRITSPTKSNNGNGVHCKRKISRHTQTALKNGEKRDGRSTETQTIAPLPITPGSVNIRKRRKSCGSAKKSTPALPKEDLGLNDNFATGNLFPNSPLPLHHDVGLQDFWEEKNTSGTQTLPEKDMFEVLNDNVTQTEFDVFYSQNASTSMHSVAKSSVALMTLPYVEDASTAVEAYPFTSTNAVSHSDPLLTDETFDDKFSSIETQTEQAYSQSLFDSYTLSRSFALSSNIETQTTDNLDNMEQLLYSNTCTQTCNEILPSDLGLSDIQTQTAWTQFDDTTVSTETQTKTPMCQTDCNIPLSVCRSWLHTQTSHTETQTDILSMFHDLNSP